jgi:hypothetical protein
MEMESGSWCGAATTKHVEMTGELRISPTLVLAMSFYLYEYVSVQSTVSLLKVQRDWAVQ